MRIRFLLRSFIVPAAIAAAACSPEVVVGTPPITDPALATYADFLDIDLATFTKTASGLYFKDVPAGWGSAVADSGDAVVVDYAGYLVNGFSFDASRVRGGPSQFRLARDSVVRGFEEGLQGMRVGGKRRLVMPPELGYGAAGSGQIPPFAILIFDVTLHGIR